MIALGYLLRTILKNKILSLKNKPAYLVLYGLILVGIVAMILTNIHRNPNLHNNTTFADIRILYTIVAGVGFLFFYSFVTTGLSTGSSLFSMADVGILFTAPLSSKKILVYGIIKQMAATFVSSIFILYQVGTLRNSFGLGIAAILSLFLIYAAIIFTCQLMAIVIYILTNGNPSRKNLVRGLLYGVFLITALAVYLLYLKNGGTILESLLNLMDNNLFHFLPVIGWAVLFTTGVVEGNLLFIVLACGLFFAGCFIAISIITYGEADYYEDVLNYTEVNYTKLQAAKNGKVIPKNLKKIKIKEKETGIQRGKGYTAIFYKHLLEKKRTSRFIFMDSYTIMASAGAGIVCYFIKNDFSVYTVLIILVYIQFFMTILGKLSDELNKPFIYLIPEKSIKKILSASLTTLIKPCFDGIIIFTVVCIITKTSPLLNLFLALAYASSGAIFVGYGLLCQRVFGGQPNKFISAILGFNLFMLIMMPGIVFSVFAILMLPAAFAFLGTLPFTFCCIVITIMIFVICQDLLDKTDFTGK